MSTGEQILRTEAHLSRGLWLARAAWLLLAALAALTLIAAIPGYLAAPSLGVLNEHLSLQRASAAYTLAWATHIASFVSALGSVALACFLFWKKRADAMGLFLAYYLLALGILFAGPIEMLEPFWPAAPWVNSFILLPLLVGPLTMALVAIFPDGRFVPSWSRWLIPTSLLTVPASFLSGDAVLPFDINPPPTLSTALVGGAIVLSIVMLVTAIYVQVYRYRLFSTPEQRYQTKWVLYGIALWAAVNVATSAAWTAALQLPANTAVPIWLSVSTLAWVTSSLILPLALTISITRYRLFEIDLIINRTLVYGVLTLGVIAIYVAIVAVMGVLFQTQANLLVALLATAVVAVIFQPLRQWLQRSVNRLVFGERDDPIEVLSQLGGRLESALPPDRVLPTLVETIARTLKLPYVAIFLAGENGDRPTAAYGEAAADVLPFPLVYQGDEIGQLRVAPRSRGLAFTSSEIRLLHNVARQAGAAVQAVLLTNDLLRSRQQIVTAREEERRRLRRDLHDGIGPAMAGQALKLDAALDLITAHEGHSSPAELGEATQLLLSLKENTQESIRSIRRIVYGLRPPALDDLGLVPALRTYAAQQTRSSKSLNVVVEAPAEGLPPLSAAVEVALYRIALEALTNVIHHARARSCWIKLSLAPDPHSEIYLFVEDDGVGLPSPMQAGVGLTSMRERATELGGHLAVEPRSPSGTQVFAAIPLLQEID